MHTRTTRITAMAACLALSLGAVGCSSDDDSTATSTDTQAPTTAEAAGGAENVVEVRLVDYGFEDLPTSIPAGTEFTFVNESDHELHELVAVLLPDDEKRSADELISVPPEEMQAMFASIHPEMVTLVTPEGEVIHAVGDGTLREPGRYLILCAIPVGADVAEYLEAAAEAVDGPPQVHGGPPHFTQGMVGELIVE